MTLDKEIMTAIERDEAWLREVMPADPPAPLERTRLRVRIEVNHVWLKRNAATDPTAADLGGVKRTVRAEIAGLAAVPASRRAWPLIRRGAGLAAAAVILLTIGLAHYRPRRAPLDDRPSAVRLDDWVDAMALDAPASGEEAADLATLEDGVASLEMSLAEDRSTAWGRQELGDLSDELEVLLTDIG